MRSPIRSLGALAALMLGALAFAAPAAAEPVLRRGPAAAQRAPVLSKQTQAAQPGIAAETGPLQVRQANLHVKSTALAPVHGGGVPEGKHVMLSIAVENSGPVASTASASYTLACEVLIGNNACPVAASSGPVPAVAPGSSRNIILVAAQGAQPGEYRLTITVDPTKGRGRAYTRDILVTPKSTLQKAALKQAVLKTVPEGFGAAGNAGATPPKPLPTVRSQNGPSLSSSAVPLQSADLPYAVNKPEYGNLWCKVVFPGGDLNPHVHVGNASGHDLPVGQQINVWLPTTSFAFPLQYPLAKNAWVAGPSVSPTQSYSQGQGKHTCIAATEID